MEDGQEAQAARCHGERGGGHQIGHNSQPTQQLSSPFLKMVGGVVPRPMGSCFHCGELDHFIQCVKAWASVQCAVSFVQG